MKKNKMKLETLKVQSFVTDLKQNASKVKGGYDESAVGFMECPSEGHDVCPHISYTCPPSFYTCDDDPDTNPPDPIVTFPSNCPCVSTTLINCG